MEKENQKYLIKYREWYKTNIIRPIKLEIPGWSGEANKHVDGDKPQPWHCIPFIEGATTGLELIYSFDADCEVRTVEGKIQFSGDFSKEWDGLENNKIIGPPFSAFAPGHYGMTSCIDLEPPFGYVTRIETHPKFYTDATGTVPCVVPGHIQRWWSRIFFVVFKAPLNGECHIFKKGQPYAQVLIVPRKSIYELSKMTTEEASKRANREKDIATNSKNLSSHGWKDHMGHPFDDKYKQLNYAYSKNGEKGVARAIHEAKGQVVKGSKLIGKFIKNKFIK